MPRSALAAWMAFGTVPRLGLAETLDSRLRFVLAPLLWYAPGPHAGRARSQAPTSPEIASRDRAAGAPVMAASARALRHPHGPDGVRGGWAPRTRHDG